MFDIGETIKELEEMKRECISYRDELLEGIRSKTPIEAIEIDTKISEITRALYEGRSLRLAAISKLEDVCDIEVASVRLEAAFEETLDILYYLKGQVAHEI